MPVYAYECNDCGVRFERRQGFDDAPVKICPECEGKVRRLIQPAGVIFKGSGFYVTDHKGGSSATSSTSKTEDASSSTSSEIKTESKSEAKSDTKAKSETKTKSESKAAAPAE
jgi:putative FmdB family regulatory protein